jgi:ATP-grasp domain, R2K clade family 2
MEEKTTLVLSNRYTIDSQRLWRAATFELGWDVERLINWRLPKKPLPNPVVYVESLFSPMIAEQLGITLLEVPEDWMVNLPRKFSGREIALTTAGEAKELLKETGSLFIKPPNDKSFAAKIYKELPDYVDDNVPVLVQEVVTWEKEFRCFCLDGKVLAISIYWKDGQSMKCEDWFSTPQETEEARTFTETVINEIESPKAVVVDVGVIKDKGWAVIELNAAWGSGVYGCDPVGALKVIRASHVY